MGELSFEWIRGGAREVGAKPILAVHDLSVRVGILPILQKVNLEIHPRDVVIVRGENGSGKSTLLNAIAGVGHATVQSGTIEVNGRLQTRAEPWARNEIVYLRQRGNVFADLTVRENLQIAGGSSAVRLFRDTYPHIARRLREEVKASLLSGGEKKLLAWAMTDLRVRQLAGLRVLLLLDEPELGVSSQLRISFGGAVLWVTHGRSDVVTHAFEEDDGSASSRLG